VYVQKTCFAKGYGSRNSLQLGGQPRPREKLQKYMIMKLYALEIIHLLSCLVACSICFNFRQGHTTELSRKICNTGWHIKEYKTYMHYVDGAI